MAGVHRRAVGVFTHRRDAEQALHELRDSGFPMDRVSVVVRDADRNDRIAGAQVSEQVGNKADGATVGLVSGGALGGLTGLLVGLGALAIPGIGPVMLAGATATTLATTLAGAGIGAVTGGLLGGLVGLGIPAERARVYNERVERGHYLVIVDGTDEEIARAEAILHRRGIEEYGIYDHSNGRHANTVTTAKIRHTGAIGVFSRREDAEVALGELQAGGFSMNQVSLIAKDDRTEIDRRYGQGNKADEGLKSGAITGGTLGGLAGLLVGLGSLAIPGVGPVILAGEVATALATALISGVIGAATGGIVGGLTGLGIPDEQAQVYSDRFSRGDYLVMVEGTDAQLDRAETILKKRGIDEFIIYAVADANSDRSNIHYKHNTTDTTYSAKVDSNDPAVVIIDRRDETV